jgi:hypothetical protein
MKSREIWNGAFANFKLLKQILPAKTGWRSVKRNTTTRPARIELMPRTPLASKQTGASLFAFFGCELTIVGTLGPGDLVRNAVEFRKQVAKKCFEGRNTLRQDAGWIARSENRSWTSGKISVKY